MPGIISKEIIEQVRQASDIVEIIGNYVQLKKAGAKFKGLSPFNKEKTPSFFVDADKQLFHCFSSGQGGDIFAFIMLYENLDFPAAVRRLAQRAGIAVPESGPGEDPRDRSQRERLLDLHGAVAAWWKTFLHRDELADPARAYLKQRKISSDLAAEFGLGFAPPGWEATMAWAQEKGYDMPLLELAGLVTTNESGKRYDRFRGRLMFPICNEGGQVVAFSGRLLDPDAKAAKYVNSPETPLFSKSRILYGLDKTKRAILDVRSAIICEGQIDLIRCFENDFKNVVAPQGTAFTEHHGRLLKRYADEVILCFDADGAGQRAAERSVETLLESGLNVRIAQMPAGDDPDTLLLSDRRDEFAKIIQSAPDYTRHLLETACRENDVTSPRGRAAVAEKMAAVVKKIPSPVQREIVATEVSARLQIPRSAFDREIDKVKTVPARADLHAPAVVAAPTISVAPTVAPLLSVLLSHPELAPVVQRQLDTQWLDNLDGAELCQRLLDTHAHDAWEDARHFVAECPETERNFLAGLILNPVPIDAEVTPEAFAASLVQNIQQKWREKRRSILEQEIKSNLLTPEQLLAKSKELLDMKRAHG